MLSENVQGALNDQMNAELYSSYLYLSMSSYFSEANLEGFAHWMYYQAQEELMHAMKFYAFVIQRGGRVILGAIETPPQEWESPEAVFEATLNHERKVTGLINALMETAMDAKDHATQIFLQWFVSEQVEEEETADGILQRLKLLQGTKEGLYMLDRELAQRQMPGAGEEA